MPSKPRLTVYLKEEQMRTLEEWAASENRAISNLAATIILKALEEYEKQKS